MALTSEACSPCDFEYPRAEDYGYIWDDEKEEYVDIEEYEAKMKKRYEEEEKEDCEDEDEIFYDQDGNREDLETVFDKLLENPR